jgi:hypothetical protein
MKDIISSSLINLTFWRGCLHVSRWIYMISWNKTWMSLESSSPLDQPKLSYWTIVTWVRISNHRKLFYDILSFLASNGVDKTTLSLYPHFIAKTFTISIKTSLIQKATITLTKSLQNDCTRKLEEVKRIVSRAYEDNQECSLNLKMP